MRAQQQRYTVIQVALCIVIVGAGLFGAAPCRAQRRERENPPVGAAAAKRFLNIGELKTRLSKYHDCALGPHSACYEKDLVAIIGRAQAYLQSHLKAGRKIAIVLDIDETSLSNWDEIKGEDFGFHSKTWNDWIESAKAPAIKPTLDLFSFAKRNGVAVFFITGRLESLRGATERNLKAAGYTGWDGLVLRPEKSKPCATYANHKERSEAVCFKAGARKKIAGDGYRILGNIGDQMSDLSGGYAERAFKLPNPFYYIP